MSPKDLPVAKRLPDGEPRPLPKRRRKPTDAQLWALVIGGILLLLIVGFVANEVRRPFFTYDPTVTSDVESRVRADLNQGYKFKTRRVYLYCDTGTHYTGYAETSIGRVNLDVLASHDGNRITLLP